MAVSRRCWGVIWFHDWHAKFYFNALIAAGVAVVAVLPAAGHAPVEGSAADRGTQQRLSARLQNTASERPAATFREIFFTYVLPNRYLWAIAMANVFCYFVRYGVENWIPTYLQMF